MPWEDCPGERLCDKSTDACEKTTFPTSILRQMSSDDRSMAVPVNLTYVAWKPSWGGIDGLTTLAPAPTFPSSVGDVQRLQSVPVIFCRVG